MTEMIFRTGDAVRITCDGRTVDGTVTLASGNGKSLIIQFEALLDSHLGMMPISLDDDGRFYALMTGTEIKLARRSH